jgi:hypothetical protein
MALRTDADACIRLPDDVMDPITAPSLVASHPAAGAMSVAPGSAVGVPMPAGGDLVERVQAGIAHARVLGAEAQAALGAFGGCGPADVEGLVLATRKADAAFRMLDAVRTAMNEAYSQARDDAR